MVSCASSVDERTRFPQITEPTMVADLLLWDSSLHSFAGKKSGGPPPEAEPLDGACITQFGHAESRGRIGSAHKHRARGAIRVQTGGVGDFKKYENPPAAPRRHMHGHMQVPAAPFLRLLSGGS